MSGSVVLMSRETRCYVLYVHKISVLCDSVTASGNLEIANLK